MILKRIFSHIFLIILGIVSIGPFIWLLSTALKSPDENIFSYPPVLMPEHATIANFIGVWNKVPFEAYIINSIIVSVFTIALNLILSALAAYPLARMEFKGKNFVFYAILSTIMVPLLALLPRIMVPGSIVSVAPDLI